MAINSKGEEVKPGRIGDLQEVANQNAKFGAADSYHAIRMQLEDGTETTALFTWGEIRVGLLRAAKNIEDVPYSGNVIDEIRDLLD